MGSIPYPQCLQLSLLPADISAVLLKISVLLLELSLLLFHLIKCLLESTTSNRKNDKSMEYKM